MKIFKVLFFPLSMFLSVYVAAIAPTVAESIMYSYSVIFVSLLTVAYFEKVIPINPEWSGIRKDSIADLLSVVTVAGGVESVLKWFFPLIVLAIYQYLPSIKLLNIHQYFNNMWIETIVVILGIEFVRYWYHRISHENFFMWKMHSSHHAPIRMYWGNSYRLNPIYHIGVSFLSILPFLIVGVDPKVFAIYNAALGIMANFQHGNIVIKYGFLNKIFSTAEIHKWHHSVVLDEAMTNYGALLSIYDVLFGTYYNPSGRIPKELGLTNEPWYPIDDYFKQIIVPFYWSKWRKDYQKVHGKIPKLNYKKI
jgi:sterol desaturase/sphingolipid hydroxylase (fatty acid hydroxylase superfamily)